MDENRALGVLHEPSSHLDVKRNGDDAADAVAVTVEAPVVLCTRSAPIDRSRCRLANVLSTTSRGIVTMGDRLLLEVRDGINGVAVFTNSIRVAEVTRLTSSRLTCRHT
jgi:hypothetical protein